MRTDVNFTSSGFQIAGHLYTPDGLGQGTHPAVVVGHPASGVKEQTAGLYAKSLCDQGLIALTFDTATQGESEGLPRGVEDASRRIEELKDAVSFLTGRDEVDSERVAMLGICASGGYTVAVVATDHRVKDLATVSGVDLGTWYRVGPDGKQAPAIFQSMLDAAAAARAATARGEVAGRLPVRPASEEEARASGPMGIDGWNYYCTDNGRHPRQADEMDWTSIDRTTVVDGFRFVDTIAPRPLLMIIGTEAVTTWMGEDAIDRAKDPKELFWIDGATHVDLYYKPEYVTPAVAKLTNYFTTNLAVA